MPKKRDNRVALTRLSYSHSEAAEMLGRTEAALYHLVNKGFIEPITDTGHRGNGIRLRYDPEELRAFALGGKKRAEAYRASRDLKAKVRRGRGRKASVA